jgi:Fe-S-cluster-containing dehydrogenase component
MARFSILIDVNKCNGCYNCFLACRDEYYGNDYPGYSAAQPLNDHFWMQVKEIERGPIPSPRSHTFPCPACTARPHPVLPHPKTRPFTAARTVSS